MAMYICRLANKQDHQNAMDEVDICDQLGLEDLVNANKCPCRIVSILQTDFFLEQYKY